VYGAYEVSEHILTRVLEYGILNAGGEEMASIENTENITPTKSIRITEKSIARNSYETAIVYDKENNELFRVSQGDASAVELTQKQWAQAYGMTLTHNHPFDLTMERYGFENTSAFSSKDILRGMQYGIAEMRMVIGNERYSFCWVTPNYEKTIQFIEGLQKIEASASAVITDTKEAVDKAVNISINNQTTENKNRAYNAILEHYSTVVTETNKINQFIADNQNAGYIFKKEVL